MRDHWCRGDHWSPGIILWTLSWSLRDPGPSVGCWFRSQAKLPGAGTGERFRFAGSFLWPLVLVRPLGSRGSQKAPALISGSSGLSGNSGNASTALPPLPGNHWQPGLDSTAVELSSVGPAARELLLLRIKSRRGAEVFTFLHHLKCQGLFDSNDFSLPSPE